MLAVEKMINGIIKKFKIDNDKGLYI